MPTLNETKEQMVVVGSVGEFTNALQQIATQRMVRLRGQVLKSRPFVETANEMLQELSALRAAMQTDDNLHINKKGKAPAGGNGRKAVIVITSNQGLTGRYNIEIYQKVDTLMESEKDSDFYIIGKKGQEYFQGRHFEKLKAYPYSVPDDFGIIDLQRLTTSFDFYEQVTLVYSHFVNSATRDVVILSVVAPASDEQPVETIEENAKPQTKEEKKEAEKAEKAKGKFIYEPDIDKLIESTGKRMRTALFQQQILDARLAQNSSQMIGMKTASDNANALLADLRVEYNKQRRKMIDKKIGEVFAGSALW